MIDELARIGAEELCRAQTLPVNARGLLPGTNMIEHQFPLRAGLMVKLVLPADLTKKEIKRLVRFMESLIWA